MAFWQESEDSPRVFENDFLDSLTRTPWIFVPMLYLPLSVGLVYYSVHYAGIGLLSSLALSVGGILAWTFAEYWLHRTLFHWIPNDSWGETLHFFVHGIHHDWPHDKYRLVMPPAASLILFLVFLVVWTTVLGSYGWAFHGGFVFGYMCYDVIHFHLHHARTRFSWLKRLKKHHTQHHFVDEYHDKKYGVSTRLWDKVFGTVE